MVYNFVVLKYFKILRRQVCSKIMYTKWLFTINRVMFTLNHVNSEFNICTQLYKIYILIYISICVHNINYAISLLWLNRTSFTLDYAFIYKFLVYGSRHKIIWIFPHKYVLKYPYVSQRVERVRIWLWSYVYISRFILYSISEDRTYLGVLIFCIFYIKIV